MNIICFEKINSTNKYAKENIETLADKTIIISDCQTNGYGQFQRAWVDAGGENVYMTFVLKPSEVLQQEHVELTLCLAEVVCELINAEFEEGKRERGKAEFLQSENSTYQLKDYASMHPCLYASIKPPNDVLINGKKVAGILAESITKGNKLKGIALGIGINLNSSAEILQTIDQPATSLSLEFGHEIKKQEFIEKLIEGFFSVYDLRRKDAETQRCKK